MAKLRWGVVGAGGIADRQSIPALLESKDCSLSAVMDVQNAEELGKKYGVPSTDSLEELLSRDDVESVYVASPVWCHPEQVKAAAAAGRHVLCEKPLAKTVAEARSAVEACREAGVLLRSGYMMRFHGAHEEIARLIGEGAIGTPVFARAQLSCWYPRMEGAWRQDPALGGGGSLMDMASHLFDLLEMFLGPVKGVAARTGSIVQDYPVEDSATALLEFRSGAHGVVDAFFSIPDAAVPLRLEIYGSAGAVQTEGTIGQGRGGSAAICRQEKGAGYEAQQERASGGYEPLPFPQVNPYSREFDDFAERVARGETIGAGAGGGSEEQLLRVLKVLEAAYESARTGRFVEV